MVIKLKSLFNTKNYSLFNRIYFFGMNNLNFKTFTLAKVQRYLNLFEKFKLKKIILKIQTLLPFIKIY